MYRYCTSVVVCSHSSAGHRDTEYTTKLKLRSSKLTHRVARSQSQPASLLKTLNGTLTVDLTQSLVLLVQE